MTDKEFKSYVFDKKRQGLSESQIARSLGMSLAHFMGKLNGVDVDKIDPPKPQAPKKEKREKQKKEPKEEPVKVEPEVEVAPEIKEAPAEDLSWME